MTKHVEVCAGALVFSKGKILLLRSHKWNNNLVMPGGHIEYGERIKDALVREIREETGLEIKDIRFIGVQEFIFDKVFYKKKHFIFLDFFCKAKGGRIKLNNEAEDYEWIKPEEALRRKDIEPYTKKVIKIYLKRFKR